MNFVPSWKHPMKRRRRRRRLKTKIYLLILIVGLIITLTVYQDWQWMEFRESYWMMEVGGSNSASYHRYYFDVGATTSLSSSSHGSANRNIRDESINHHLLRGTGGSLVPKSLFTQRNDTDLQQKSAVANGSIADTAKEGVGGNFLRESRKSLKFSDFVSYHYDEGSHSTASSVTYEEAKKGREPVIDILEHELGFAKLTTLEILQLPLWKEIQELYGSKPRIVGLDTCLRYQNKVPLSERYIGVAGTFNAGTTAFGLSLQANCRFPNRKKRPPSSPGNALTNVHGMLNQVPWAKHKMAHERFDNTIDDSIEKENVLPVVLVRDPYYWMQSMCKQGYGVRWDHNAAKHCPNLVPNDYDKKRFAKRHKDPSFKKSVPVWMGQSYQLGPHWDSLVHYWNDWYESYFHDNNTVHNYNASSANEGSQPRPAQKFPRLLIRFEDTLFHAKTVMKLVCACGGGIFSDNNEEDDEVIDEVGHGGLSGSFFRPIVDEAKFQHKHDQNNLVSAMIKYGTDAGRYRNLTTDDLEFAKAHLNKELMEAFHYKMGQ